MTKLTKFFLLSGLGTLMAFIVFSIFGYKVGTDEFSFDYALSSINAGPAYAQEHFGQNITVGLVGTGINPDHAELSGQVVPGYDFITQTPGEAFNDTIGHETAMGGLIAGKMNRRWGHGVAPKAKVMPLRINIGEHTFSKVSTFVYLSSNLYDFLLRKDIKIVNNSYGRQNRADANFNGEAVWLNYPPGYFNDFNYQAHNIHARNLAQQLSERDLIAVWGTGNDGWNTQHKLEFWNKAHPGKTFSVSRKVFISLAFITNSSYAPPGKSPIAMKAIPNVNKPMPYFEALYPFFALPSSDLLTLGLAGEDLVADNYHAYDTLQARWLAVAAVDANGTLAEVSNGCGPAKNWCLAAPGEHVKIHSLHGHGFYKSTGTSIAAAIVSGALAVLKSAFPEMSMITLKNILLESATRDGPGPWPNEIYGHGIINLGAAYELALTRHLGNPEADVPLSWEE